MRNFMAELALKTRLQPSLLDRLTDHHPEEAHEPREARAIGELQLRELLRRDLSWLLNTTHLAAVRDLSPYPEASRSVLNFGIPDLAGKTLSSIEPKLLERFIKDAIISYEPRLLRRSLKLHVISGKTASGHSGLLFDIEGELWSQPIPLALYLRTEIDLENGSVRVDDVLDGVR
ncbi:MAG: type secretion system lysozyme [Myxococcaceae bacterium]|nr:type secretion system lysozyme [Myxococcaceae bacterium]